jgi:2-amino-4-hydroxy-6-hydroxymethyldihydropteridine diphosphokinase
MRAYLSLGTNVGDRYAHLAGALAIVAEDDAMRISSVYRTEPVGGVDQEEFWNLVVELETEADPRALLERARRAESAAGRTREVRWGPRTLDVDLLLVGDLEVADPDLVVPHPRMYERAFVLAPLAELEPALLSEAQRAAGVGWVERLGTLESLR